MQNIYEYCKKIYLIDDEEFIKSIIEKAPKAIIDIDSAIDYMKFAWKYWKMKSLKLKQYNIHTNFDAIEKTIKELLI